MKRLLAAAAFALLATTAHAGQYKPMPIELVGEWCSVDHEGEASNYLLPSWLGDDKKCTDILHIDPWGFAYGDNNCNPISIRLKKDHAPSGTAYTAKLKAICNRSSESKGLTLDFVIERYKGNLSLTVND